MLGQYDHSDDAQVGERVVHRPALRIELQASERKLLASVRNSLLGWLSDPSVNSISREVGRPAKISLEEIDSQPGPGAVGTLRLNVVWAPENVACAEPAAEPMGQGALLLACPGETSEQNPPQQFVFFADPPILYSQLAHVPMEATSDQAAIAHADRVRHALGPHRPPIARAMRKAEIRTLGLLSASALALYAAARTVATRWLTAGWSRVVGGVLLLQKRLLKIDLRLAWRDAGSRAHAGGVAAAAGIAVLFFVVVAPRVLGPAAPSLPVRDGLSPERHAPLSTAGSQARRTAVDLPRPVPTTQAAASGSDRSDVATASERASIRPVGPPEKVGTIGTYSPVRSEALRPEAPPPAAAGFVRPRTPAARPAAPAFVGTLLVKSEPEGAEVSINGMPEGRTPLTIPGLPAGSRVVRLDLPGYERWTSSVRVVANARTPVAVKLQPEIRAGSPSY